MKPKFLEEISNPKALLHKLGTCDWHLYMVTFWACLGFIGLGSSLLVFGPTLLDLADRLGVGVELLAIMFTCRSIGGAVGSVVCGIAMDKLERYAYTIMCLIYIACIATTVVLPLSVHIVMLGLFMALNGLATGGLDNGTHAVLIKLWKDKAGPCMQVLHFGFALGTFIAPLVAKPFITERTNDTVSLNSTLPCHDASNTTATENLLWSFELNDMVNLTQCFDKLQMVCEELGKDDVVSIDHNCTLFSQDSYPIFAWAYWIAGATFVPSLIAFMYFSVRKEIAGKCCANSNSMRSRSMDEDNVSSNKTSDQPSRKKPLWFVIVMFTLLFIFLFLYVGLEVCYGSLLFTVSVTGELNFSKSDASILTSLFWGTFAFMRLFSVLLAFLNVRSSVMLTGNLSGSFLASLIFVFFPHDRVAIWISTAVLGASYASIYPTTMTWMSENTVASGKATSVLVAAGTLGDISIPSIVGVVIAKVSPDSLFYITFGGIVVSAIIVAVLFLFTCLYNKRKNKFERKKRKDLKMKRSKNGTYKKLENTEQIGLDDKSTECDDSAL